LKHLFCSTESAEPAFLSKLEPEVVVLEKAELKLTAEISGKPQPDLKWYINGREIYPGRRMTIETTETTSILIISEVREEDEGEITVTASNKQGSCSQSCKLFIKSNYFSLTIFRTIKIIDFSI